MNYNAEALQFYEEARKKALRAFNAEKGKGQPYLSVMEVRPESSGVVGYMSGSVKSIPLERIIGSAQGSRANSFACNFMPLLPVNTEFAHKWITLCGAHLESGFYEPIRVYEYLWRYYVVEGHKRISVLKFFGAANYEARVTRLIPEWNSADPDVIRYYKFINYEKKGLFPDIELSTPDLYDRLSHIEDRLLKQRAEEDAPLDYAALYRSFEAIYPQTQCPLPAGDAFVEYLHVYGFPCVLLPHELKERLDALKLQLDLMEKCAGPQILLDQKEEAPPLLSRLLPVHKNPKVVFAYRPGRSEDNWIGAHEHGRLAAQELFGDKLQSVCIDGLDRENAYERLSESAANAGLLFVVSPALMDPVLRFALENPSCTTLVYSRLQYRHRLHTYFGRYYEAAFLCGVAAGQYTRTGSVAYVTPRLEDTRITSDINAFALGVRSVCACAHVWLLSKGVVPGERESCAQAIKRAAQLNCDLVFSPYYDALSSLNAPRRAFSALFTIDENGTPLRYLASPDWNWDSFYISTIRSYLNGSLNALLSADREESPVKSFWWGIGAGILDVELAALPEGASANLLRYLKSSIGSGQFNPFHGPVFDSDGIERIEAHSNPSPLEIMDMRYLVDSIETEEARE